MRVFVLQSNYLPWKGYFDLIHDADRFVFYDEVQYTKNDWRNRNRVYARSGLHWLTVPISPKATRGPIRDAVPSDERWRVKHEKSLRAAYGQAPHWDELAELLGGLYRGEPWPRLIDVNRFAIRYLARRLGCETELLDAADYELAGADRVERLLGLLEQVGAERYVSGPAARRYLEGCEARFAERGIALEWKDYGGYPEYAQRREPFEAGVTVLDLIAHVGFERAPWYVWGWRQGEG
ncbi:MAG: WbqC family protein [Acidobacteriota bacterium]